MMSRVDRNDTEIPTELLIDSLNIRLPKGYEKRANSIARYVAKHLSGSGLQDISSLHLESLTIPKLQITDGESNSVIARRVARAVESQIVSASENSAMHTRGGEQQIKNNNQHNNQSGSA
ncbi:hypothetical protein NBRC116494_21630 [Aurantivibrio plasticivorans]